MVIRPQYVQDFADANDAAPWMAKIRRLHARADELKFTALGASERTNSARSDTTAAKDLLARRVQQAASLGGVPPPEHVRADEAAIARATDALAEASRASKEVHAKANAARELVQRAENYLAQLATGGR